LTGKEISDDNRLKQLGRNLANRVAKEYDALHFNGACEEILELVRSSNKFIDESAPWSLFKGGQQSEVETILYSVLESVRLSAYLLSPLIPQISNKIYQQLGIFIDFNDQTAVSQLFPFAQHSHWGTYLFAKELGQPEPIFTRLELPTNDS
jgi:methionyl-tRNA synthetase